MNLEIFITLGIVLTVLALLVANRLPIDLIALISLVALSLSQLVPGMTPIISNEELIAGFSSNAVISIIAIMIIATGLERSGGSRIIATLLLRASHKGSPQTLRSLMMLSVGGLSGLMQNVGACALYIPVVRHICLRRNFNSGFLMMPMGFAVLLGGCITMLGSSPLIVLNDLLPDSVADFSLFEVAPIGIALLISGVVYFQLWGHRYLPPAAQLDQQQNNQRLNSLYGIDSQLHTFKIGADFDFVDAQTGLIEQKFNINIIAISHYSLSISPHRNMTIPAGCDIAVIGDPEAISALMAQKGITISQDCEHLLEAVSPTNAGIAEIIIPPGSTLAGKRIRDIRIRRNYGITPLAIFRQYHARHLDLRDVKLQVGDSLLSYISWQDLNTLLNDKDFAIIDQTEPKLVIAPDKLTIAVSAFVIAIGLSLLSPLSLSISLLCGATIMLVGGVLSMEDAYHAISWKTVFLLAGLLPLGTAMRHSGASTWLAEHTIALLGDNASLFVLQLTLALLASSLSLVISNIGATIVLVPLALSLAHSAGFDPRPLILIIGICASNAFLLPTNQVSALIQTPGNYSVREFKQVGSGLTVIYIVVVIAVIRWL